MGRILEALKRAEKPHDHPAEALAPPLASEFKVFAEEEETEVPYIEIGAKGVPPQLSSGLREAAPPPPVLSPTLAMPRFQPLPEVVPSPRRTIEFRPVQAEAELRATATRRFASELVAFHDPDGEISTELRRLWNDLTPSLAGEQGGVFYFSGVKPQSGRTAMVLNLAITAAKAATSVLVLEANFTAPALARRLGLSPTPGVREALAGQSSLAQIVRETGLPGLHVVTAGEMNRHHADDLFAEMLPALLRQLRSRASVVLVDGSAWTNSAAEMALARAADATILVAGSSESNQAALSDLAVQLGQLGCQVPGIIVSHTL